MKRFLLFLICTGVFMSFSGCDPRSDKKSREFETMDTYMRLEIYSSTEKVADLLQESVEELDRRLSVTNSDGEDNEIFRLNQNGSSAVSSEVAELARRSLDLCAETDGALDITVAPVVNEWGFISKDYRVPSEERLSELLPLVDYTRVSCGEAEISLEQPGMKLDFGAVAKGYAADKALEILKDNGVKKAVLNLGGTVVAHGEKQEDKPWRIGIADPEDSASYMGYIGCSDKVVATSGSYERFFKGDDGKTYSHIIDPSTGCPVDNDILSVSIVSENGLRSDGLSTALFVMGREKAERYRAEHQDFDYIIITKDKKVYISEGIAADFTIADDSYTIVTE